MTELAQEPPGALARWQRLKAADPQRPFDDLQHAACWESCGMEAQAMGDSRFADHCYTQARRIMAAASIPAPMVMPTMVVPRARRRRVSAGLEGLA